MITVINIVKSHCMFTILNMSCHVMCHSYVEINMVK